MPLSATLHRNIHLSHAKQLAQLQLPSLRGTREIPEPDVILKAITSWVSDNPKAVKAAQDSQCASTGPDSPNWDVVLFSLVESVATDLRINDEVVKATEAARSGNLEQAALHLEKSQEYIDQAAALLDCTFIQLCDFVTQGPDGLPFLSGAFCGLFLSNNTEKPFMGVAFKGTITDQEWLTDAVEIPIKPLRPEVAWGAPMHAGFYEGLFGTFTSEENGPQVPFDFMLENLFAAYASHGNAQLHFTGHSLGGAYCMITYGEFLRRQAEPTFAHFKFGDMYPLGGPRVCLQPFADEVNRRTQDPKGGKYSFRIVNGQDPVPTMPPLLKETLDVFPYVHVGGAWRITLDGPEKMDDEPPQVDPQGFDFPQNKHYHGPEEYYASWQKTPHS